MTDLSSLIIAGSSNVWLFIPSAIALGALHGLGKRGTNHIPRA